MSTRLNRIALTLLLAPPALLACQSSPEDAGDATTSGGQLTEDVRCDGSVGPDAEETPLDRADAQPTADPDAALPEPAPCPSGAFDPLPACTPALEGTLCYQSDCVRNSTDQIGATYLCSNGHWDEAERGGWDCGPVQETCAELGAVPGAPCPAELDHWGCDWEVTCPGIEPWTEQIGCYYGARSEPLPCP